MENKEDIINFLIMLDLQRMAEIDALSREGYVALTNLQYDEKIVNLHIKDVVNYINDMTIEVKFKYHQQVYVVLNNEIYRGQIDVFDIFSKKYLVYIEKDNIGNEWCEPEIIFGTMKDAKIKLKRRANNELYHN